jgi:hypothetical protein
MVYNVGNWLGFYQGSFEGLYAARQFKRVVEG